MEEAQVQEQVVSYVTKTFLRGAGIEEIHPDDSFMGKGIMDSTGVLELVSFLEETFGVRVEDEELIPDNLDSLSKVQAYIKKKLAHAG